MTEARKTKKSKPNQVREESPVYGTIPARRYDLEERTFAFAQQVRTFVRGLPRTLANIEDAKQLIRASASVGANYIEANEALSRKDFAMRIKICRKEAKESAFFLRLLQANDADRRRLLQEATELTHIFGAIVTKVS